MSASPDEGSSDSSSWISLEVEEICDSCRAINFAQAFIASPKTSTKFSQIIRGEFKLDELHSECCLCAEIELSAFNWRDKACYDDWQLMAFPPPASFLDLVGDAMSLNLAAAGAIWVQAVPSGWSLKRRDSLIYTAQRTLHTGWIACYNTACAPGMFLPKVISPVFDAIIVKKWLAACSSSHSHLCNASGSVPGLKLIDCVTLQLCYVEPQPDYIALSYVWGESQSIDNILVFAAADSPQKLPPLDSLPQVIRDTIYVTKELGFRYLWIDRYCVNQIDTIIQEEQIDNMGAIYHEAELTIIATAGDDDRYGLPGVGVERTRQFTTEIGSFTIMHFPSDIQTVTKRSKWGTRGWTFQEELLSRRRLYFSDEQVFFSCNSMECCEALGGIELATCIDSMRKYSTATSESEFHMGINVGEIDGSIKYLAQLTNLPAEEQRYQQFLGLLSQYSERHLTYEFDSIRAFAGVQKYFEYGGLPISSIQGLPMLFFEKALLEDASKQFAAALSWEHILPGRSRRRSFYPSWTWAGWTERVHFPCAAESFHGYQGYPQNISFEYKDGSIRSLQDIWRSLVQQNLGFYQSDQDRKRATAFATAKGLISPIAVLSTAAVVPSDLFAFVNHSKWETGTFFGMEFLHLAGKHTLDCMPPFSPLYFLNGLSVGTLGCLLLGFDKIILPRQKYRAHLLIVQWYRPYEAHRIAKLTAETEEEIYDSLSQQAGKFERMDVKLV